MNFSLVITVPGVPQIVRRIHGRCPRCVRAEWAHHVDCQGSCRHRRGPGRCGVSDIVERLRANMDKYPGFENMNSEAAAEITTLRLRVAEYKLAHEGSEAVIHMAIARMGGLVEGRPTHRGNFLQRIDELVRKEQA